MQTPMDKRSTYLLVLGLLKKPRFLKHEAFYFSETCQAFLREPKHNILAQA